MSHQLCRKTSNSENLVGRFFGESEVISFNSSSSQGNGRIWNLRCKCGQEYQATTTILNKGRKHHCGCLRNFPMPGKVYGNGIIIKEEGRTKRGEKLWLMQCKCDKQYTAHTSVLINGNTKSCGCLRLERFGVPLGLEVNYTWYKCYIKSARERKLEFNLTIQDIVDLFAEQQGVCALTGRKLILPTTSKLYRSNKYTASIDRINNDLGYTKENIQIIHKELNMVKWILSNDDFIKLCKEVTDYAKSTTIS